MTKRPRTASKTASKLCLRPIPESALKNINFDTHNFTLASNGLKRPPWPPRLVTSNFFSILALCSWKPRRKKSQPREIWAQSVPWNPFKQAFKGQNSLKQPQKQPQNYVWGQLWNLHEKSGIFFISLQYLMVLDLMEWFRLTSEVKSTLSQTFRWGLAHSIY